MGGAEFGSAYDGDVAGWLGSARDRRRRRGSTVIAAQSRSTRISAIGRASEMTRRSDPSDRTGRVSTRRGWLDPLVLGDASTKRASAPRGTSVVSRDDASPEALHDLLTDAQLAVRWQLSRGTLANQRSQGRGPAYLKLAGRVRYRRSDIEAYEQAGLVSREPAGPTSLGDPSDVRETVERLIGSLGS
jgi:hypothetical protein